MAGLADEIAVLRGTTPATFANLLRIPAFSRLWRAMLVSSLGDWVGFVAVTSLVARLGRDSAGFAVAGVMIARLLPSVVFGPFAGVLVDRFDRKRLMVVADLARGAGYASMPLLGHLPAIFALTFAIECLSLLWTPARDASIPNLVPRRQLGNANTVGLLTSYGTLPLGGIVFTALAGVGAVVATRVSYFDIHKEALALWLDALTFAFSAFMIYRLQLPSRARRSKRRLTPSDAVGDLVEGVRFLRAHPFQRAMTIGIVLAFTGVGSVIGLGPIFAMTTVGGGAAGWGMLLTAVGIGLAAGMLSMSYITRFVEKDVLFPVAMLWSAASAIVLGTMPTLATAALMTAITGVGAGLTWVTGYTLLHENIADEFRGRTFGSLTVLSRFGMFLSLAGFPALAQLLGTNIITIGDTEITVAGTRLAMWGGGVVVLAGALLARRGLSKSRLSRPRALSLNPQLRKGERHGAFIVFEGVEGAGKGTQIRLAREFLESEGYTVLVTREPGGTELGERLREALLDPASGHIDARAEALLFSASRAQHVASVIRPALEEGKVVVCDRFVDSSVAYQGVGRGLGEQDVLSLNVWATQGLFPDLVVLLHLEPEEGLARTGDPDRIEAEGAAFLAKVSEAYLNIAAEHPERFVVVQAGDTPDVVHERVKEALSKFLKTEKR